MRTFHTAGVRGARKVTDTKGNVIYEERRDITQGLPRVEELFEARRPQQGLARICDQSGIVQSIAYGPNNSRLITIGPGPDVTDEEALEADTRIYEIPQHGNLIIVTEGQEVEAGDPLTAGPLDPKRILELKGVKGVFNYLLREVQRVYKLQGVDINDKHIEIIVSQMLSKYRVTEPGDTSLLPDKNYSKAEIEEVNASLAEGLTPAEYVRVLQGITKASLATESFLSAASFQETTKVLTGAAIEGKTDNLLGLKENVIIGKLIPAGTGMEMYNGIEVDYKGNTEYMENYGKEAPMPPELFGGFDDEDEEEEPAGLQKTAAGIEDGAGAEAPEIVELENIDVREIILDN